MPETDIAQLDLAHLRTTVMQFQDLFHHRTVLLEPVRRMTYRNMAHLTDAMDRCEASGHTHSGKDDMIRCRQTVMLNDQGLEVTPLTLMLTGLSTFAPMKLYLALLYAELEYFQKRLTATTSLQDEGFSKYLSCKVEWLGALKSFRLQFLRPGSKPGGEEEFLQTRDSYNLAPMVQSKLDEYLEQRRLHLHGMIQSALDCLPDIQWVNVLWRFIGLNFKRMEACQDGAGIRRLTEMASKVREQVGRLSETNKKNPLDLDTLPQKANAIDILAQCMNVVNFV